MPLKGGTVISIDPRWKQLGDLLVNYSAAVKPGERVMIAMSELEPFPLVQAVYEAAIKAGALPQVQFLSEKLRHLVLRFGNEAQLRWVPEIEAYGMEWADVYFGLRGANRLDIHGDIPSDRLAANQTAMGKVSSLRWKKTRWCLVRVPNAEFARRAGTDLETMMEMFFGACLIDWKEAAGKWGRWAERLSRASTIRVVGHETDLRFSTEGRKWVVGDGRMNMPDGEIFTAPLSETVDGEIYFEFPGVLGGRLMHDIRLRWDRGRLLEARSSSNQDFLESIVRTDPGADRIGEFGLGTNPVVTRFCKDILIDEKIGGTVHIALGRAYPACGGSNTSSIHWDIIKDTRKNGTVFADGEPVLRDGEFLMDAPPSVHASSTGM
ncbi:MAG: aminopeptidase [Terriglobia bacterium]